MSIPFTSSRDGGERAASLLRFVLVVAAHAVVLAIIVYTQPELRKQVAPVLVSLITPPERVVEPPPPPPPPPRKPPPAAKPAVAPPPPAPAPPRPVETPAPNAISVEAPPPAPAAPVPVPSAPAVAAPAAVATAPPAPPAPVPVTPARYDAAYLNNPVPSYPLAAKRLGEQGTVVLLVFVNADGTPGKVDVKASSGSARLDQAARDAVARWRFVPARQGDRPIGVNVEVPVVFRLDG